MKVADQIIFTKITGADFYNMYKAPGADLRGGGQSYIDFSTAAIPVSIWREFFTGLAEVQVTHGPSWDFELNSLGLELPQPSRVYQRRAASVCITSQKLKRTSRRGNRVFAWHPEYTNFPPPSHPPTSASDPLIAPADEPHNVVVVSAHMHRMLHYANVSEIDLSKITDNKLDVEINGEAYTISWHSAHSQLVEEAIEKINRVSGSV